MQITNNYNNPRFKGISINASQMSQKQRNIADRLYDAMKSSIAYDKFEKSNLEFVLFPASKERVNVKIMDLLSGKFVRKDKKINSTLSHNTRAFDLVDDIFAFAERIKDGKIARPKPEAKKLKDPDFFINKIFREGKNYIGKTCDYIRDSSLPYKFPEEGLNREF